MPLAAWIAEAFLAITAAFVGRVLLSMGFSLAVYTGIGFLFAEMQQTAVDSLAGLPPNVVAVLGLLKIGTCLNMLFSAYATRLGIVGLAAASYKKLTMS